MSAVRVYPRRGAHPRAAQVQVVGDGRLDLAEVVDRLRDEGGRRLGVDGILGAHLHAPPSAAGFRGDVAVADIPRIYRQLEVGTAGKVVRVVDSVVHAPAPVGRGAYREVGACGESDHSHAPRVDVVLRGVAPQDADCALDVAQRRVALVRRAVQEDGGGESYGVEPVRDLRALLVPSELAVSSARKYHDDRLRALALRGEEGEERIVYVRDYEVALPELVLEVRDRLVAGLHRDLAFGPQPGVRGGVVPPELRDERGAGLGRVGVRAVALRIVFLP